MALTRADLREMGLEDSVIEKIIQKHAETVSGLKTATEAAKDTAGQEIQELKEKLSEMQTAMRQAKEGYDALKQDFATYKAAAEKSQANRAKESAYRDLLKAIGIKGDRRLDAILRTVDLDKLELDETGALKGREDLEKVAKEDWSEFIPTTETKGANTKTPPENGETKLSKDQISAIKDPSARRAAIAENLQLFEKGD